MRNAIAAVLLVLLCAAALAQPQAPAQPPAAPTGPEQPGKVLLELKFAPGEVLRYRGFADLTGTMNMAMTGAPQQPQQPQQPFNMQMMLGGKGNAAATARVVKTDPYGGARLRVRLDNFAAALDFMGQKIHMALKNGKLTMTANGKPIKQAGLPIMPAGKALPLLQNPIEIKLGKRGQMMDIVIPGFEKEWKQMMAQAKQMYGGIDPMTIMRQGQILLPDHPIGVGEGWNHHVEVPLAGGAPVVMDMNFTLDNLETVNGKQIATIGVTGRETMTNIDLQTMMKQGMAQAGPQMRQMGQVPPISGKMNGEFGISGKARFNVTAGTLERYDFRADLNFQMESSIPVGQAGQQRPMAMTANMVGQINGALARLQ